MLLIRNKGDAKKMLSDEMHKAFLKKCEVYIEHLKKDGKLLSAQPLVREGKTISGSSGNWKETEFDETSEVQVGYYHILAEDINDAITIAKENPEFEFTSNARIEVRPIKTKENTGYVYPKHSN